MYVIVNMLYASNTECCIVQKMLNKKFFQSINLSEVRGARYKGEGNLIALPCPRYSWPCSSSFSPILAFSFFLPLSRAVPYKPDIRFPYVSVRFA